MSLALAFAGGSARRPASITARHREQGVTLPPLGELQLVLRPCCSSAHGALGARCTRHELEVAFALQPRFAHVPQEVSNAAASTGEAVRLS